MIKLHNTIIFGINGKINMHSIITRQELKALFDE